MEIVIIALCVNNWMGCFSAFTGISSQFTQDTYNLLSNNCNNFTDECAKFLTGKGAPSYVTALPSEFMNTYCESEMYTKNRTFEVVFSTR